MDALLAKVNAARGYPRCEALHGAQVIGRAVPCSRPDGARCTTPAEMRVDCPYHTRAHVEARDVGAGQWAVITDDVVRAEMAVAEKALETDIVAATEPQ
ncbi:MAG: hypothetical protein ACRCU1_00375 [Alsobacter sp.]